MGFVRTVLIVVVAFYVIGFIGRLLVPFLIKRQVRKFQQENKTYNYNQKPEGEVSVKEEKQNNKLIDENDAEYVDYEEVDE